MAKKSSKGTDNSDEHPAGTAGVCTQCGNHVPSEGHDQTCDFHPDSLAHSREHDS